MVDFRKAAFANIAEVVDLTNIGTLFAFVLVSAGVIFLRRAEPERVRPFRVPGVPFTPLISIAACLYLMLQLPKIMATGSALGHDLGDLHANLAIVMLVLVGLHVTGGIYHHFVLKDDTLSRMR